MHSDDNHPNHDEAQPHDSEDVLDAMAGGSVSPITPFDTKYEAQRARGLIDLCDLPAATRGSATKILMAFSHHFHGAPRGDDSDDNLTDATFAMIERALPDAQRKIELEWKSRLALVLLCLGVHLRQATKVEVRDFDHPLIIWNPFSEPLPTWCERHSVQHIEVGADSFDFRRSDEKPRLESCRIEPLEWNLLSRHVFSDLPTIIGHSPSAIVRDAFAKFLPLQPKCFPFLVGFLASIDVNGRE